MITITRCSAPYPDRTSVQAVFDPLQITTAVQNGPDSGRTVVDSIIDGVRKPLGEQPMVAVVKGVNTGVQAQRVDVGSERI